MNLDAMLDKRLATQARDPAYNALMRGDGVGVGVGRGNWNPIEELKVIVTRCCKGGVCDQERLILELAKYCQTAESAYAGTVGVLAAELDGKPNNAITLSGNNAAAGATYLPNTPIPLFQRTAGVLSAQPGVTLQTWLTIQRIVADPVDSANGWKLVGGSVVCTNDPVPTFPFDVAFSVLRPEIDREDSPLAQLYNRPVLVTSQLTMSAIHYGAAPIQLIQGVTIEFQDMKCPDWVSGTFGPNPRRIPFANVVNRIVELVRMHYPDAAPYVQQAVSSRWGL